MVGKVRRYVVVLVVSVVVVVAVLAMKIPKTETVHADHMNVAAEQARVNVLLLIVVFSIPVGSGLNLFWLRPLRRTRAFSRRK
ncbi:hypothetical protein L1887_39190 [Cichorium endivia]|nr:hypothetical protein L1887_39190 [Cichorium endivia]